MADAREESSEDSSDRTSSDNFSIYTETSSSEEDLQNVEEPRTSTSSATTHNSRKGKSKSSSKQPTVKRSKRTTNSLNDDQMKELTSWIFSTQEANEVEVHIRSSLFESPRVASTKERNRFTKHLLCKAQKDNFQLLIVGFFRKFSTLVSERATLSDEQNRKAAFSVALDENAVVNFQVGKPTQERMIIELLLVGQQFSPVVVRVIHEMVYCTTHSHVQLRKSNSTSEQRNSCLAVESDDTSFRCCGAALHGMIKLRKETLQQKKGRGKVSTERRLIMEKELDLLNTLVMKDKSSISVSLKNLDEGNLIFPRIELVPFFKGGG